MKKRSRGELMFFTEKAFFEHALFIRNLAKDRWNRFSTSEIISFLASFVPTKIFYSKIDKGVEYSDLGYFAPVIDCLFGRKKPKELICNKPIGSFFVYKFDGDKLKSVYQNDGKRDLTGDVTYIVSDNLRVSLSIDNASLNCVIETIENDLYFEEVIIERNGEMISSVIQSKTDNRFFLFKSQLFFESLDEIKIDDNADVLNVKSIHKRLKTKDEIQQSIKGSGMNFSDKAIEVNVNMLKEGGFKYYEI